MSKSLTPGILFSLSILRRVAEAINKQDLEFRERTAAVRVINSIILTLEAIVEEANASNSKR